MNRGRELRVGDEVVVDDRWLFLQKELHRGEHTNVFRARDYTTKTSLTSPLVVKHFRDKKIVDLRTREAAGHWKEVRDRLLGLGVPDILHWDTNFQLTEYIPLANLNDCAFALDGLNTLYVKQIILDIFSQIAVLIDHGFVHSDVKGSNVVLTNGRDRLGTLVDFDFLRRVGPRDSNRILGTPFFMPPELLSGGHGSRTGDVFSLGMMALELLGGGSFDNSNLSLKTCGISNDMYQSCREKIWPPPQLKATLAKQLLVREPGHRRDIHGLVGFVNASLNSDPAARPKSLQEAEQLLSDTGNLSEI
jgi:serine/threonine protein kinase